MRLIDADALREEHCEDCKPDIQEDCKYDPICASLIWVHEAPTVEAIPIEQVARMFFTLVGGTDPCTWNDMEYFAVRDDWCAEHCGETNCKEKTMQCWLHAIGEGWMDDD